MIQTPLDLRHAIRDELERQGITQKQMASDMGITAKHVSQVFNGRVGWSLPMMFRMLDYLNLEIDVRPKVSDEDQHDRK